MTKENLFERFKKYKINIENVNFKSIEQYEKDITFQPLLLFEGI